MPGNRDKTGRFIKGESGNPAGRPAVDPKAKRMLKEAAPEAVRLLISVMESEAAPLKDRREAAKTILDRVYGTASQPIEGELSGGVVVALADGLDELAG